MTVAASFTVAYYGVAVLWVGNIASLYWVVDVVMLDKEAPQWIAEGQDDRQRRISESEAAPTGRPSWGGVSKPQRRRRERSCAAKSPIWKNANRGSNARSPGTNTATAIRRPLSADDSVQDAASRLSVGGRRHAAEEPFRVAGTYYTSRLGNLVATELRKEFITQTLRLDLGTFRGQSPGDLMNRFTTDVQVASTGAQNVYGMVLREPMKVIRLPRRRRVGQLATAADYAHLQRRSRVCDQQTGGVAQAGQSQGAARNFRSSTNDSKKPSPA